MMRKHIISYTIQTPITSLCVLDIISLPKNTMSLCPETGNETALIVVLVHTLVCTPLHLPISPLEGVLKAARPQLVAWLFTQRSYSYAKMFISAPSPRDLKEVTPSGGRRARKP